MIKDAKHYEAMFDYLSAPQLPDSTEAAVIFGRKDPLIARALGDLIVPNLVEIAVITGGVGKDSGDLLDLGYDSEASFLGAELTLDATKRDYKLPEIVLEKNATNGRENAQNSVKILHDRGIATNSLTAVAHATSALRLAETLKFEAMQLNNGVAPAIHRAPSAYNFDASNPSDREEAALELLRLADWPQSGNLLLRDDLPDELVEFAHDTYGKAPAPVKPWQAAILRRLPKNAQLRVINFAANHGRR